MHRDRFYTLSASCPDQVGIIARVDLYDPKLTPTDNKTTDIIGGVSYQLSPNVRLLADLDRLSFENSAQARITTGLFQLQFTF